MTNYSHASISFLSQQFLCDFEECCPFVRTKTTVAILPPSYVTPQYVTQCVHMATIILTEHIRYEGHSVLNELQQQSSSQSSGGASSSASQDRPQDRLDVGYCQDVSRRLHLATHILCCPPLRMAVLSARVLPLLSSQLTAANQPPWQGTMVQRTTMLIAESVSAQVPLLLDMSSGGSSGSGRRGYVVFVFCWG